MKNVAWIFRRPNNFYPFIFMNRPTAAILAGVSTLLACERTASKPQAPEAQVAATSSATVGRVQKALSVECFTSLGGRKANFEAWLAAGGTEAAQVTKLSEDFGRAMLDSCFIDAPDAENAPEIFTIGTGGG